MESSSSEPGLPQTRYWWSRA